MDLHFTTTTHNDKTNQLLTLSKAVIGTMKRSILAHPDCTEGSEFDDYTSLAEETEELIEKFLNNKEWQKKK